MSQIPTIYKQPESNCSAQIKSRFVNRGDKEQSKLPKGMNMPCMKGSNKTKTHS